MNLIENFSERAKKYMAHLDNARVYPANSEIEKLESLRIPLQDEPLSAEKVLAELDETGSPATVVTTGGRYFGFVIGGSLPAAMSAKLMSAVWDQNAGLTLMSPIAHTLEEIASEWLLDLFGLPSSCATGFVSGDTMANFSALASARHHLLKLNGWNAEEQGLFGAPEITVITGEEVHVSVLKALNMVGMGRSRIVKVPVDSQGRMIASLVPKVDGPCIICVQAGNVNTGSFDPIGEICERNKNEQTWIHVDGAFGMWAAVKKKKKNLAKGIELADSWATDAHKWLNVPYDCGLVFVKRKEALFNAMSATASYLPEMNTREPYQFTPEMSREARGIPVWAALRSLGKKGLNELIERNCSQARKIASSLASAGYEILNDVVLNQVMVSFGTAEETNRIMKNIQEEGTCWCGGTVWQGKTSMRISVSSWATTDEDIEKSVSAILKVARKNKSVPA